MSGTARYWFTQFWASVLVGLGVSVMALGTVGAGLLVLLPDRIPLPVYWPRYLVAAVACAGGLLLGAPLIVSGQLVQVLLDQRRILGRIQHRLHRWEDEREAERIHPMRGPERPV
jgi:hypothetical protein